MIWGILLFWIVIIFGAFSVHWLLGVIALFVTYLFIANIFDF